MWENLVGRSRRFWEHYLPVLRQHFPDQLRRVEVDPMALLAAPASIGPDLVDIKGRLIHSRSKKGGLYEVGIQFVEPGEDAFVGNVDPTLADAGRGDRGTGRDGFLTKEIAGRDLGNTIAFANKLGLRALTCARSTQ